MNKRFIFLALFIFVPIRGFSSQVVPLTIHGEHHTDLKCIEQKQQYALKANSGEVYLGLEGLSYDDSDEFEGGLENLFPNLTLSQSHKFFGFEYQQLLLWTKYESTSYALYGMFPHLIDGHVPDDEDDKKSVENYIAKYFLQPFGNLWRADADFRKIFVKYFPGFKLDISSNDGQVAIDNIFPVYNLENFFKTFQPGYEDYLVRLENPDPTKSNIFYDYRDLKFSKLPKKARKIAKDYFADKSRVQFAIDQAKQAPDKLDPSATSAEVYYYMIYLRTLLWMPVISKKVNEIIKNTSENTSPAPVVLIVGNDHVDQLNDLIQAELGDKVKISVERCEKE